MSLKPSLVVLALAALPLTACQEVGLVDNVDLTFDWKQLVGPSDALHSPYVVGSSFDIWVTTAKKQSLKNWRLVSGDEGVLKFGTPVFSSDQEDMSVPVQTLRAGTVEVKVHDSADEVRHTHTIEVKQPDRIDLLAHGQLLIDREDEAVIDHPKILAGGTATFLARYFAGGEQLNGNGALSISSDSTADAHVEHTFLFEDRDWLQISPEASLAEAQLGLVVGGETVRQLPVSVVGESAIDHIELIGQDESHVSDGEWLVVLAQAFDTAQGFIYGVEYKFTTDGTLALGSGDLYRYGYKDSKPVMLEATHGEHVNGVLIHSGGGFVDSTNRLGCEFAPSSAPIGVTPILLLGAFALFVRRRRAR
jgi:hypothetical protein